MLFISVFSLVIRLRRKKDSIQKYLNPYIKEHISYDTDRKQYEAYLKWCLAKNKIPMDERGYREFREKDKKMYSLLNDD